MLRLSRVGFDSVAEHRKLIALDGCMSAVSSGGRWSLVTRDPDRLVTSLVRSGEPFEDLVIDRLPLGAAVDKLVARRDGSATTERLQAQGCDA